jgi:phospholipid-translocating ATPase
MKECIYLGHIVGNGQVRPDPTKLAAVRNFPVPTTKKQVRGFLGLTGYYRKFILNYATVAAPLTDLTKKRLPDKVNWTPECGVAFETLKGALCESPVLMNPDFAKQFILQTDASNRGVGAVLSQLDDDGKDRPIAYFSRKLLPSEERYSTVEQLAIKLGVEAFKVYLIGRSFVIQTDHRSLTCMVKTIKGEQQQIDSLESCLTTIYIRGGT